MASPGIGHEPDCNAPPVFGASEHYLDAITIYVAALVAFHDILVRPPATNADLHSLSANAFRSRSASYPRSASSRSAFGRSPGSAAAGVVADLSGQHVEPYQAAFRISDGVQFPSQATFCPIDLLTASTLFCTQFASRALCLHRDPIDYDRVRIGPLAERLTMIRAKITSSLQRFKC